MSTPDHHWRTWCEGMRVVVRYQIEDGLTDALGEITAIDAAGLTISTKRGTVRVAAKNITLAKRVPPPPQRRS